MIAKLLVYKCRNCESQNIVKNGHNASGIQRTFSVSRPTLTGRLKKDASNPKVKETFLPAEPEDVLEADEMRPFVYQRRNKRWL